MPIAFTAPTLSNTSQFGGRQDDVRTVGLSTGGYVVAWESTVGVVQTVHFQRYDALGNQVGARTQVDVAGSTNAELFDIVATADGTFTILTDIQLGAGLANERLALHSWFGTTGGPTAAPTVLNLTVLGPNGIAGAQLTPDSTAVNSVVVTARVIDGAATQDLVRGVISTSGVIVAAPVVVVPNGPGGASLIETVEAPNGAEFVIAAAFIIGTGSPTGIAITQRDAISLAPGTLVIASNITGGLSPQVSLTMLSGSDLNLGQYQISNPVVGTSAPGFVTAGAQSFAIELVDLGEGRILTVWVADFGNVDNGPGFNDGVYAQVYNINTGAPEGIATLIRGFGTGPNSGPLAGITISADLMADGRVSLGLSYENGLRGLDVFSTILDARVAGVTVAATSAGAESFVGTDFNDTFTGVSTGDTIIGGAGIDTVTFGTSAARSVDLLTPGSFPANSSALSGIENLTGNNGADLFRGDAAANLLSGLAGNDTLSGRDGNDSMLGGNNDDLLSGGNGSDLLDGGAGIDTLDGGTGDDLLFGGADADRMVGGSENDTLNGGDANDRLLGDAGNDILSGDAGDDILVGGAGDDEISGGAGLDTLRAEDGADQVYGGADNDTIFAHAGVALVDGGTGTDTLRVSGPLAVNTAGVHVDLTGVFDLLGLVAPLTRFAEEISGIENVTGGTGNDFITGDAAVNVLRGGAGNDTLVSGGGADILFGNAGSDVFVFTGTTGGADELRDYDINTDSIGLVNGAFGDLNSFNIGEVGRLTINATGTVGATALAQFIFDNNGAGFGQLFFDADGNGAGAAVLLATLTLTTGTLSSINAAEFLFL
jgi:Ca2+-binding RTX toxin-like protein